MMAVAWQETTFGHWRGLVDGLLLAEVCWYGTEHRRHWVGWARRERVPGQHGTADEAKAAVEAALIASND